MEFDVVPASLKEVEFDMVPANLKEVTPSPNMFESIQL